MIPREDSAGSVGLVGALVPGVTGAGLPVVLKSWIGLDAGLLKVIRPGSWLTKAAIAKGNFTE